MLVAVGVCGVRGCRSYDGSKTAEIPGALDPGERVWSEGPGLRPVRRGRGWLGSAAAVFVVPGLDDLPPLEPVNIGETVG